MIRKKIPNYNDGLVRIYRVENISEPGNMPKDGISRKYTLRYKERTVGLDRYYKALNANVKVSYVLRCGLLRDVSTQDIAIPNDGKQYRIVQIQYPEDATPPAMDLTLEEVKTAYDIKRP